MKLTLPRSLALAGVAAVAFAGCLQEGPGLSTSHASNVAATQSSAAPLVAGAGATAATPAMRAGLPDFSTLVEQVGPAVVNIAVSSVRSSGGETAGENPFADDPFYDFLRRFGVPTPGQPGGQGGQPRVQQGVGSGFIVSADGYVLTNAHVVDGATDVTVRLTDKREFKAKVVGSDKRTDVALIKIDAKNLPTVKIGDAEHAKVGEWVVAVGSPFGFDNTVTAGIISAKARRLPDETYVPFIQTDVAINPGNSGGPLFNLNGEVIGINSQIYSRSGGFMGISFAIPIDTAMKVRDQLQKYGKVQRGRLGVLIQGMDDDLAQTFGLDKAKGALVAQVDADGPAAKAGVEAGDVILAVNGQEVKDSGDLPRLIGDQKPGDKVTLKVWRNKSSKELTATLAEMPGEGTKTAKAGKGAEKPSGKVGLALRQLTASEANRVGLTGGGLVVEDVAGPAAEAGVRPGDVIISVNNRRVTTVQEMSSIVDSAGDRFALLILRGNQRVFVPIRLK
ncbi:DegQ family serine endoprotease [Niveibacterium umoris]|uniref:Probable periplasmic serine endoprotease DegP-like n=1 Tax=Niveibacterium umoris TaxID=1193620 RepID=A0A840BSB2_9RHOO|nr:DegQ family serine endoprotease [Niveibacterium umoris]MBB4013716.1 serine protease Do [Niveibacterium umoris]